MPHDPTIMAPQPPQGGWPNRRADDVRIAQQAEQIRLLQIDLKNALSQHADIENSYDSLEAKAQKYWQILVIVGGLLTTGFGWAVYQSGFAKADELRKTQDKVAAQDVQIAQVKQSVDDLKEQARDANKKLDKLLERTDAGPRRRKP